MVVQVVSHGVAKERSPRRKPWRKIRTRQQPRQGRQNSDQTAIVNWPASWRNVDVWARRTDAGGNQNRGNAAGNENANGVSSFSPGLPAPGGPPWVSSPQIIFQPQTGLRLWPRADVPQILGLSLMPPSTDRDGAHRATPPCLFHP